MGSTGPGPLRYRSQELLAGRGAEEQGGRGPDLQASVTSHARLRKGNQGGPWLESRGK